MTEYIICPLCGKSVKRLKKHLRMAKEHKDLDIEKFLEENPSIPLLSESERQRYSDAQTDYCNSQKGHEQMVRMANISWNKPESKEKLMEGRKKQHESEEFKELHRKVGRGTMQRLMSQKGFFPLAKSYKYSLGGWYQYQLKSGKILNLRSKIEYDIAECLDKYNLEFGYETELIPYTDDKGNSHTYYLDFYVPSLDLAVEGKYETAWGTKDTKNKLNLARSKYKNVMLVGSNLTELKWFIESSTAIESVSNEKDIRE